MSTPTVGIGSIRLHDAVVPDLVAGRYRLRSGLEVSDRTHGTTLESPAEGSGVIEVAAPRYVLDRTEVISCHPPRSASGAFGDRLPHVVLGRRTLPWERRFTDGTPWLALLLLRTDEADLAPGRLRAGLGANVVAAMEALDPIDGDPQVTLLRVHDLGVFRAVLPTKREVRLLTHVRQVNVADSALAQGDDDGWFAVVTANRLPLAGDDGAEFVACLVSLEARDDVWTVPDGSPPPALLALQTWTFTSTGAGGTFEHLLAGLDLAPFGAPAAGAATVIDPGGSLRLDRTARDGTAATATYRGPLLGLAPLELPPSLDDVSAAAAGELGRLLAAADGRFIREVVAWHRTTDALARTTAVGRRVAPALAALSPPSDEPQRAATQGGAGAVLDPRALAATVLGAVRRGHDRPANLWQVHPAADTVIARRRR